MIRVVIDTNVLVSSLLSSGSPKAVLDLAFDSEFTWFVTDPILKEYEAVLKYPVFKIDLLDAQFTIRAIKKQAKEIFPTKVLNVALDRDDNKFLECAETAKANYLVTGNLKHFPKVWKYTKVVPPIEFLRLWQVQKPVNK